MIAPVRYVLDRLLDRGRPSIHESVARMAHLLAQPPSCDDDAMKAAIAEQKAKTEKADQPKAKSAAQAKRGKKA